MPKVSNYTRARIESLYKQDFHHAEIFHKIQKENLPVSFASITRIIKKLQLTGSVKNLKRSGRPPKLSTEAKALMEAEMRRNEEATSIKIQKKLAEQGITGSCLNSTKILVPTRLDIADNTLLPADKRSQQSQKTRVRSASFEQWRHV